MNKLTGLPEVKEVRDEPKGGIHNYIICPHCKHPSYAKVVDSRANHQTNRIRRRRECMRCHGRYTTYEILVGELEVEEDKIAEIRKLYRKLKKAFKEFH